MCEMTCWRSVGLAAALVAAGPATADEKRMTLSGHTKPVNGVAFSPDGKLLASGGNDGSVRLWDARTGKAVNTLNGHAAAVTYVTFSPDGKFVASSGMDRQVRLWDPKTGKSLATLLHSAPVWCVAVSPDSGTVAAGVANGTVSTWSVETRNQLTAFKATLFPTNFVTFSPDGKTVATRNLVVEGFMVTSAIRRWDVRSGASVSAIGQATDRHYRAACFDPEGKLLASCSDDGVVRLWDVKTEALRHSLHGHSGPVVTAAFLTGGKVLVSGGDDKTIRLWDVVTGKETGKLAGLSDPVYRLAVSPNDKHVAAACGNMVTLLPLP